MNYFLKLSFLLILTNISCKDSATEQNINSKENEISNNSVKINPEIEKLRIESLIKSEKLDYYHYLKPWEETKLIEYTGDDNVFEQLEIDKEYQVYYENSHVVAVKEFDQWGDNGHCSIIYYYNNNGKLFCYDYYSIGYAEGEVEDKATIYFDENIDITNESYQRKTTSSISKDKINFEGKPMFYETVEEIMNAFSLEECKSKIYKTSSSNSNSTLVSQTNNEGLMSLRDIQLSLYDSSLKKSKILLGEPDVYEINFGHITKGLAIYYNVVSNPNGKPKHLVLFLRMVGSQWGSNAEIEEIYAIDDNQKACFGIHCIKIINQTIYTNELGLIQDRGYNSIN